MFNNIGGKIKTLAQVVCWLGIIASVIFGIILMLDNVLSGFMVLILGCFFSWIGSFMTYGFGQLVENSDILVENQKDIGVQKTRLFETSNDKINTLKKWKEQGLITEEEYNLKIEDLK